MIRRVGALLTVSVLFFSCSQNPVDASLDDKAGPGLPVEMPILIRNTLDVWRMSADGLVMDRITATDELEDNPEWSPDGEQIVYDRLKDFESDDAEPEYDIYVMNADGTDQRLLADVSHREFEPSWSPNGKWIVFSAELGEQSDLYLVRPDGTDLHRLTRTKLSEAEPQWSPDGRLIAFSCFRKEANVCLIRKDGSGYRKLTHSTNDGRGSPSWSPSGKRIVFAYSPPKDGLPRLRVINKDGSRERLIGKRRDQEPIWGPGGWIMFIHVRDDGMHDGIWLMRPDGSDRHQINRVGVGEDWLDY